MRASGSASSIAEIRRAHGARGGWEGQGRRVDEERRGLSSCRLVALFEEEVLMQTDDGSRAFPESATRRAIAAPLHAATAPASHERGAQLPPCLMCYAPIDPSRAPVSCMSRSPFHPCGHNTSGFRSRFRGCSEDEQIVAKRVGKCTEDACGLED
jgi:hypothetical protein